MVEIQIQIEIEIEIEMPLYLEFGFVAVSRMTQSDDLDRSIEIGRLEIFKR